MHPCIAEQGHLFKVVGQTVQLREHMQTDRWMDEHYQVHYLLVMQAITTETHIICYHFNNQMIDPILLQHSSGMRLTQREIG